MLVSTVGTAQAAPTIQYGLQDDAWLAAGPGPNTLPERIALLKTLGVKIVRYNLLWNKTAPQSPTDPTDPSDAAYDWAFSDPVVNALHDAGIPVLLTIYGTPPGRTAITLRPMRRRAQPRLRDLLPPRRAATPG